MAKTTKLNYEKYTYAYHVSEWLSYSKYCGNRIRIVSCRDCEGKAVSDEKCEGSDLNNRKDVFQNLNGNNWIGVVLYFEFIKY